MNDDTTADRPRTEADLRTYYQRLPVDEAAQRRLEARVTQIASGGELAGRSDATGRPGRRRPTGALIAACVATAVAVLVVAGFVLVPRLGSSGSSPTSEPGPPHVKVGDAVAFAGAELLDLQKRGPLSTTTVLQVRSLADGHLLANLDTVTGATNVSAAVEPDGHVLVAVSRDCHTTFTRIDPVTGARLAAGTLDRYVSQLTVSPDGTKIAYTTYASCRLPLGGLPGFFPNVLVVETLATHQTVRTSTPDEGNPFFGIAWSPDSTQLAAGFSSERLLVLDAAHPSFVDATRVPQPAGCSYTGAVWTVRGIVTAEGCGAERGLGEGSLVLVQPGGTVLQQWRLPSCIDGLSVVTDQSRQLMAVQTDIGYGSGACGAVWSERISRVNGAQLRTVVQFPQPDGGGAGYQTVAIRN